MGSPKPLLRWRGKTLVESQIDALREGGASEVIVVLGHRASEIFPLVSEAAERNPASNIRVVVNGEYRDGRTTSIKAGLNVVSGEATDVVVMAVDQPRTADIVSRVVRAHLDADALLTSPRYRGRGGHPLMFSARLLPELRLISEEGQGLREVFERHCSEINQVVFDDPMIRLDLNTPEAYAEAYAAYGSGASG